MHNTNMLWLNPSKVPVGRNSEVCHYIEPFLCEVLVDTLSEQHATLCPSCCTQSWMLSAIIWQQ